jgi:hypothetical protein
MPTSHEREETDSLTRSRTDPSSLIESSSNTTQDENLRGISRDGREAALIGLEDIQSPFSTQAPEFDQRQDDNTKDARPEQDIDIDYYLDR